MAPYSMDLRSRALRDSDAGVPSAEVAAKYAVSRAWVDRVKNRSCPKFVRQTYDEITHESRSSDLFLQGSL